MLLLQTDKERGEVGETNEWMNEFPNMVLYNDDDTVVVVQERQKTDNSCWNNINNLHCVINYVGNLEGEW